MSVRWGTRAGLARYFSADTSGVAAVEMAFIAPIALALLSLGVAGGQTLTLDHKVVLAAHSITDLVSRTVYQQDPNNSQAELLNQSDLDTDIAFSQLIMYPNSTGVLQAVVSMLQINASNNTGTVIWSEPGAGATALPLNSTVQLDPSYGATGATYLLYGQVTYTFQPLGGILSLPSITLSSTETLTIRNAPKIDVQYGS